MTAQGHSRLSQPVMPPSRCPLPPQSDHAAALQRNDAMGQKRPLSRIFRLALAKPRFRGYDPRNPARRCSSQRYFNVR
jgi:hypothetical protein